ncbi:NCF4 [Branchiostoma lanceolatum]|uniref:NCF4 protein n=1 Tax=Branchiostoma lanceolatum TaxID=7740 RepID=A0A8K0AE62_BRALA|nr:NCF4 [Branchiostoma lanceolatum]
MPRPIRSRSVRGATPDNVAVAAKIIDLEKRRGITNYYLYVTEVTLNNSSSYQIFRRYSQFDALQADLVARFPIEAGDINAKDRVLPSLPGKIFFGRSAIREVAERRLPELNKYMKELLSLDPKISRDPDVRLFFSQTESDVLALENREKQGIVGSAPQTSFKPSLNSNTANKTSPRPKVKPSRPRPPVPRRPSKPPSIVKGPRAKVLYPFEARTTDELSLLAGTTVSLLHRVNQDWIEGKYNMKTGLFPAAYVEIIEDLDEDLEEGEDEWDDPEPVAVIRCHFSGGVRDIEVHPTFVENPAFKELLTLVRQSLQRQDLVMNYLDHEGDLIRIKDQEDVDLMINQSERKTLPRQLSRQPSSSQYVPWEVHATLEKDYSVYHVKDTPPRRS